jgi:hypothetical protein
MSTTQRILLMTALGLYAALVFILDAITPPGIDIWVLNLPVIVVPVFFRNVRIVLLFSLACSAMVILGSFSPPAWGDQPPWDVMNRGMGIATPMADRGHELQHHQAIDSTRQCITGA